ELRQHPRAVRQPGHGRAADAGDVEHDRFGAVELVEERLYQLDVRADAVEEQERRPRTVARPHADAQRAAADFMHADLHHFSSTYVPGAAQMPSMLAGGGSIASHRAFTHSS